MKFILEDKYKAAESPAASLPAKKGFWFIFDKGNMLSFPKKDNKTTEGAKSRLYAGEVRCKSGSPTGYGGTQGSQQAAEHTREVPELVSPLDIGIVTTPPVCFGTLDGTECWAAEVAAGSCVLPCGIAKQAAVKGKTAGAEQAAGGAQGAAAVGKPGSAAEGGGNHQSLEFKNLRDLIFSLGDEFFAIAARAFQVIKWYNGTKYCSACSAELKDSETERAKICTKCAKIFYPVIAPAIIVAVTRGNKLLLAHNNAYPDPNRYSIIAGFVELGESFEQAVAREVEEEVSIKVKNIKYFGSQSWPFPHTLMVGFTAEYESGEIKVDGVEIGKADWFEASNFPTIPGYGSISRMLIDNFVANNS
ncbi:MAG: NAD(+) diphosphatase [Spirochaetes bacterium]|nr:NAD(+) diphosphatase [Spirochaetota bacterium]